MKIQQSIVYTDDKNIDIFCFFDDLYKEFKSQNMAFE